MKRWHAYLREVHQDWPDSADEKYDAETLGKFCAEHGGKPGDHVDYSIQVRSKVLRAKFPKLPPKTNGKAPGGSEWDHPIRGEDYRDLGRMEDGVWLAFLVEMDSDEPFDEPACYRRHGRDVPPEVARRARA